MSTPLLKKLAVVGLLALGGCAYNLTLVSNMTGDDVAKGTASKYGKLISITLDNRIYSGHYVYPTPAPVALASYAQSMPTPAGIVVGVDGVGNGTISAATDRNEELRCVFSYKENAPGGTGQCVTQGGRVFALRIAKLW
jgi:hypothetical protein